MKFIRREDDVVFKRYYSFKKEIINGNTIVYKDGNKVGKKKKSEYLNGPKPKLITKIQKLSNDLASKKGFIRKSFNSNKANSLEVGMRYAVYLFKDPFILINGERINIEIIDNGSTLDLDGDVLFILEIKDDIITGSGLIGAGVCNIKFRLKDNKTK